MSTVERDSVIAAFTEEQTARLTHVSQRQLRYWASRGFFVPSITFDDGILSNMRLYSFRDVVSLRVISMIRNEAKIPLSELRLTKEKLAHLGDDLWAKTTLYILGKRIVFKNPDTGGKEEVVSRQGVFEIPLQIVTGDMEKSARDMRQRDSAMIGKITKKRGVAQGQPVIAGTRIPVRSIKAFAREGYSVAEINKSYPGITESDILSAMSYEDVA